MVLLLKNINWEKRKQQIQSQESFIDKYGDTWKEISLGEVADLTPSGKHRVFGRPGRHKDRPGGYKRWVRSPGLFVHPVSKDEQEDNDWWKDLLEQGDKHGVYIRPSSDRSRSFIMAGILIKERSET
jgi:hypothetical protein